MKMSPLSDGWVGVIAGLRSTELVGRLFVGGLLSREASLDPSPYGRRLYAGAGWPREATYPPDLSPYRGRWGAHPWWWVPPYGARTPTVANIQTFKSSNTDVASASCP